MQAHWQGAPIAAIAPHQGPGVRGAGAHCHKILIIFFKKYRVEKWRAGAQKRQYLWNA